MTAHDLRALAEAAPKATFHPGSIEHHHHLAFKDACKPERILHILNELEALRAGKENADILRAKRNALVEENKILHAALSPQAHALLQAAFAYGEPQLPDGGDCGESDLKTAAEAFRQSVLGVPPSLLVGASKSDNHFWTGIIHEAPDGKCYRERETSPGERRARGLNPDCLYDWNGTKMTAAALLSLSDSVDPRTGVRPPAYPQFCWEPIGLGGFQ